MNKFLLNFSVFDYVIIGLILMSVLIGFARGFLKETISLITWFAALFVALHFAVIVSPHLVSFISAEKPRYAASIVIIFIGVLFVGMIINFLAGKLVSTSGLGVFDRLLGLGFGAARGLLLAVIVLLILEMSPYAHAAWLSSSKMVSLLNPLMQSAKVMIPKNMVSYKHFFSSAST